MYFYLAFEAIRVIIFAQSTKPRGCFLAFAWNDRSLAGGATIGLFLGKVIRAIDLLLIIHDELIMRQVLLADHTSETFWKNVKRLSRILNSKFIGLTCVKGRGVSANHVTHNWFPTFRTIVSLFPVMLFAIISAIERITSANNRLSTFSAFLRSQLVIAFTNGLAFKKEVLAAQCFATNLAFQASWMIGLLSGFNAIPLDWLLADAAFISDFLKKSRLRELVRNVPQRLLELTS